MSIVLSSDTFVKSGVTSNETISYPRETFPFLICFTSVFVLLMSFWEEKNNNHYSKVWKRLLCTKSIHFSFNNEIYIYTECYLLSIGPLGLVLANIFMVELERTAIPSLSNNIKLWKRYVDDTIAFVIIDTIKSVLLSLNSYHGNIHSKI